MRKRDSEQQTHVNTHTCLYAFRCESCKSRARQIGRQPAAMAFDKCVVGAFIMRQYSLEMSNFVIFTGIPVSSSMNWWITINTIKILYFVKNYIFILCNNCILISFIHLM